MGNRSRFSQTDHSNLALERKPHWRDGRVFLIGSTIRLALFGSAVALLSGCGDDFKSIGQAAEFQSGTGSQPISGSVGDGPVANAAIEFIDADGNIIGTTTSDEMAHYRFELPEDTNLPLTIRATGGVDLVTGSPLDFEMLSQTDESVSVQDLSTLNVSPITTIEHYLRSCAPQFVSAANASEIVRGSVGTGLLAVNSQSELVSERNAAAFVKANEILAEAMRRTAQQAQDGSTVDSIAFQIGCDLHDGLLDGNGGENSRTAALVRSNMFATLVEGLTDSLKVGGTSAAQRMDEAVRVIAPTATLLTRDVSATQVTIDVLSQHLTAMQNLSDDGAFLELAEALAHTDPAHVAGALTALQGQGMEEALTDLTAAVAAADEAMIAQTHRSARDYLQVEAPTVTLEANSDRVEEGQSATLSWSSTRSTVCSASDDWDGARSLSGSATSGPILDTSSFTLTCVGPGGITSATVAVGSPTAAVPIEEVSRAVPVEEVSTTVPIEEVSSVPSVEGRPTAGDQDDGPNTDSQDENQPPSDNGAPSNGVAVELTVAQDWLNSPGTAELSWTSQGASSCTASGGWNGQKSVNGSESVSGILTNQTFTIVCEGASGRALTSTSVQLRQAIFNWEVPTLNSDGSQLLNLKGYRIYIGRSSGEYDEAADIEDPSATSHVMSLNPGTYYFNLKSVASTGVESEYSGELSTTIR